MMSNNIMATTAVIGLTEELHEGQVLLKLDSRPKTCYLEDVSIKFYFKNGRYLARGSL